MPMRTMHRVNGNMFQDLLRYEEKAREMTEQKDVSAQGGAGNPFEEIKKLADAPDPYSPAPERLSRIMAICDAAVSGTLTPAACVSPSDFATFIYLCGLGDRLSRHVAESILQKFDVRPK